MSLYHKKTITFGNLKDELEVVSKKVENLKLPSGFTEFVLYVVAELFANVEEHSWARKITTILKINKRLGLIEISDDGIGFRNSYLSKKIYPKDDFSAIEFALSGLSTKDAKERGFGLYSIKKLAGGLGGKMLIESGSAKTLIQKNKIIFRPRATEIQGVKVSLHVPVKKLDFYKIIA